MKVAVDAKTVLLLAGWILAGLASVALIAQHIKWSNQQALWQQELAQWQDKLTEQAQHTVELELIIADLHLQRDESGPGLNETAEKTGSAINNVFNRVRSSFKRAQ